MNMNVSDSGTIAVRKVNNYDPTVTAEKTAELLELLQVEKELKPSMKVVLKLNLIAARKPQDAVTTHPAVVRGVCLYLRSKGITDITLVDSPSGPYTKEALRRIYQTAGLLPLEEEGLCRLNYDTSWEEVFTPEGFTHRSFSRITPVLKADYLINLPKLKTHSMVLFSCGVKNLFGTIPGLQKPEMHYRCPDTVQFSHMLVELARSVSPDLTLIDGIEGMEGNGPTGGDVRKIGLLMASRNVFQLDRFAADAAGVDPDSVLMLKEAADAGLCSRDEGILLGDRISPLDPPLKLPDTIDVTFADRFPSLIREPLKKLVSAALHPVPKVDPALCIGCGKCAESCPQKLIRIEDHKARFTRRGCISCFCCQEMCPQKAIHVQRIFK